MASASLVSVILPLHDVAPFLGPCIQSLQAQTHPRFEVILVDDGSADGSGEVAARAAERDSRFQLLTQENRGLSAARNAGLARAQGDLIAFVDGDDRVAPDYIAGLLEGLEATGAPWASCGLRYAPIGAASQPHAALHGLHPPALDAGDPPRLMPLATWPEVIAHYPSAWNKLYRRELIEGLRFDEGTWFEDHAFFLRVAARCDAIAHVPRTLYWQTMGRAGQITAQADDRVFQQIAVLERIEGLFDDSKPGAREAFSRLAARLSTERAAVIADPDRRARFAAASRDLLAARDIPPAAAFEAPDDPSVSPAWGRVVAGRAPVSVVIAWAGEHALLATSLASLAAQTMPDAEVILVDDGRAHRLPEGSGPTLRRLTARGGAAGARNAGLAAATGDLVVFLEVGDSLAPWALACWADRMLRSGADLGVSGFSIGARGPFHSGFHDGTAPPPPEGPLALGPGVALRLNGHLSSRIFRRAFLQEADLRFPPDPLSAEALLLEAAVRARKAEYFAGAGATRSVAPVAVRARQEVPPLRRLLGALDRMGRRAALAALPRGWQQRLFGRALNRVLEQGRFESDAGRARFFTQARAHARRYPGGPAAGPDPDLDPGLRALWHDDRPDRRLLPEGRLALSLDFSAADYANIDLLDAAGVSVLFHLSLRAREGRAVINHRLLGVWGRERRRRARLATGSRVEIDLAPPRVTVRLDGRRIFSTRRGLPDLGRVGAMDFHGGVVRHSIETRPGTEAELTLLADLGLEGWVREARTNADWRLAVPGQAPVPLIGFTAPPGVGLTGVLPGRIWRQAGEALELQLEGDGQSVGPPLHLTRADLALRIERLLRTHEITDAPAVLGALEHIRHADLLDRLSPPQRDRALAAAAFYRLPLGGQETPGAPPTGDAVSLALRALSGPLTEAATDGKQIGQTLAALPPLAPEDARAATRALTGLACRANQPDALAALPHLAGDSAARASGSAFPALLLAGRADEIAPLIDGLAAAPGDGIDLAALRWTLEQVLTKDLPQTGKIARAVLGLAARMAEWPEGRIADADLLAMLVRLLREGPVRAEAAGTALRCCALMPGFWDLLGDPPAALTETRADAERVFAAFDGGSRDAARAALDRLEAAGTMRGEAFRLALDGPLSLALASPTDPSRALRALAAPMLALDPETEARLAPAAASAVTAAYGAEKLPQAPYLDLQIATSRAALDLLARVPDPSDPLTAPLAALARDCATLADEDSGHIGVTLALSLLAGLIAQGAEAAIPVQAGHARALLAQLPDRARNSPALASGRATLARRDHPAARALLEGMAPAGPDSLPAHPLFDTLVVVFSCRPNLTTRIPALRKGWLGDLKALGVPHVIVVGNGGDETGARLEGDVLHLDAPDDYEGLPEKTLAAIAWVRDNTGAAHLLKIDDDCFLDAERFFHSQSHRKVDYHGRFLIRQPGQMDRSWHQEKSRSDRGRFERDRSPEPATYGDGGSGYALSRRAMEALGRALDTPAGRRLRLLSFMEDKLLGDLLALEGITVSEEDYTTSIRRRTRPGGPPVPRWENSFFPSRAAPVTQLHLDEVESLPLARKLRHSDSLWPRKIWPTRAAPRLRYNSNTLELVSPEARLRGLEGAPVALVAAMRNEITALPGFLAHYRGLGVGAFLIADNLSDDGTLEALLAEPDVAVFSADTDYGAARYGVTWQETLMANLRPGRWSLLADADERLVIPADLPQSLPEALDSAGFTGANAVRTPLLDLYPGGPLSQADPGAEDLFAMAPFCDLRPFSHWPGPGRYGEEGMPTSALRHRLLPWARPDLFLAEKTALLRWHPGMDLAAGLHFAAGTRPAQRQMLLAHFKYHAGFHAKARAEVARGQHFNAAEEYRAYLARLDAGLETLFDPAVSVPWREAFQVRALLSPEPSGS